MQQVLVTDMELSLRKTPYDISLKNKQLAKQLTEEQRTEIRNRLFKSKRLAVVDKRKASVQVPMQLVKPSDQLAIPPCNGLYKMSLKFILNE